MATALAKWLDQVRRACEQSYDPRNGAPAPIPFPPSGMGAVQQAADQLVKAGLLKAKDARPRHIHVVNTRDGSDVVIGGTFPDPLVLFPTPPVEWMREIKKQRGNVRWMPGLETPKDTYGEDTPVLLLDVEEQGTFKARALVLSPWRIQRWVDLTVRVAHPNYLFKRVAFLPT